MNKFHELLQQIAGLNHIKSIAWHVYEREEARNNKVMIRVEDEAGEVLEIPVYDQHAHGEVLRGQCETLALLLLMRLYRENGIEPDTHWLSVYMNLSEEVNTAREILPYTGKNWVNEERARLYDHVQPERIF
jgi:hypothetical protein